MEAECPSVAPVSCRYSRRGPLHLLHKEPQWQVVLLQRQFLQGDDGGEGAAGVTLLAVLSATGTEAPGTKNVIFQENNIKISPQLPVCLICHENLRGGLSLEECRHRPRILGERATQYTYKTLLSLM